MGAYLVNKLKALKNKYPVIKEIRGMGLMLGVELKIKGAVVVSECVRRGLLINCTHDKVLRLMPPLMVTKKDIDKAIKILDKALNTKGEK
jgi:acetylornithine/N-succinyldiaminopimelate aminotransferase